MSVSSNIPELSVSELAQSLKRTLEESYARVRVRGELSKVKIHSSGHLYSDLKDADAVLNIICWRGTLAKLNLQPEEGLDVICTGRITSYPARSNYQMVVDQMELAGEGALLKLLEDRKKRLLAEGLFDESRKRPLPFLPKCIGVITSPTGAVIQDILHRLRDRCPTNVLLWPVRVQGDGAAAEIVAAINGMNKIENSPEIQRPDLIIVARGGGSLEDLMPFNDEGVVRAAANSHIPLISAVGHETDTTLIDFASDLRAPTPTAAAELAVPERIGLLAYLSEGEARLRSSLTRLLKQEQDHLRHMVARLGSPQKFWEGKAQALDLASTRMTRFMERILQIQTQNLLKTGAKLPHPGQIMALSAQKLVQTSDRLSRHAILDLEKRENRLNSYTKLLNALSFRSVLNRGFAVIRDNQGHLVTSRAEIQVGQPAIIEFYDGRIKSVVEEKS